MSKVFSLQQSEHREGSSSLDRLRIMGQSFAKRNWRSVLFFHFHEADSADKLEKNPAKQFQPALSELQIQPDLSVRL